MKKRRVRIGLRTIKTVAAVMIAMIAVHFYGATASKLIFAMVGAMAAVQPTFKESLEACFTQIVGVLLGSLVGIGLLALPLYPLFAIGIGMVLVITFYNFVGVSFSPSLPCFIVVMLCTTPDIPPLTYALGRTWDTAIGLGIGLAINSLVFPYDNSHQIRAAMKGVDREVISFLEEMFDGDQILPDAAKMAAIAQDIKRQLKIFSEQRFLMGLRKRRDELKRLQRCETMAEQLVAHMEVLCCIGTPGRLSETNRNRLLSCGAAIEDKRKSDSVMERDVVTNYHVEAILKLRRELLDMLKK